MEVGSSHMTAFVPTGMTARLELSTKIIAASPQEEGEAARKGSTVQKDRAWLKGPVLS